MLRIVMSVVCVAAVAAALLGSPIDTHGDESTDNPKPETPGEITSQQRALFREGSPAPSMPGDRGDRLDVDRAEQRPSRMGPGRMGPGRMGPGRMGPGRMRPGTMGRGRGGGTSILDDIYALDLTEAQQSRMSEIRQEVASKIQAFIQQELPTGFGAGRGLVIGEMREKLLREAYDKASAMLTPEQKEQLAKLSSVPSATGGTDELEQIDHDLLAMLARITPPQSDSEGGPFESSTERVHRNPIDTHVQAALRAKGIAPAVLCSDAVFVRRVHLDVIGAIPTAREVVEFLQDKRPGKRPELIDALLQRSEFADYQAMRWCDVLRVKAEFPIKLWPNGAAVYHRWIRDAIRTLLQERSR